MTDGIIKGSGNSRYLKSVPNALTLYPTYASFMQALAAGNFPIDLNGRNAAGWNTQGTSLNKAALLKDSTAAMYGRGSAAVPDEVLADLGVYSQYWWKRALLSKGTETQFGIASTSVGVDDERTVWYSDSLTILDGRVSLSGDLKSIVISTKTTLSELGVLVGKYFQIPIVSSFASVFYGTAAVSAPATMKVQEVTAGNEAYVQSSSKTAYPDEGISGSYCYKAVGRPLDFFKAPKTACFSYKGTGTKNGITLTFPFEPKFVAIEGYGMSSANRSVCLWVDGGAYILDIYSSTVLTQARRLKNTLKIFGNAFTSNGDYACLNHAGTPYAVAAFG